MRELAKLLVEVVATDEYSSRHKVRSWLADGTPFEIGVPRHKVQLIENSTPQRGWMEVVFSGENAQRQASVTLPEPNITYGNRVTVATKNIMRANEGTRKEEGDTSKFVSGEEVSQGD